MKNFIINIVLILSTTAILFEYLNNFEHCKVQYSLVNFKDYFISDTLVFHTKNTLSGCDGPCSENTYIGYLKLRKTNNRVQAPDKYNRTKSFGYIPVWYSEFSNSCLYKGWDWSSVYNTKDDWFNVLLFFLWFPGLCYFIYLKTNKKWLFLFLVAYLFALVYLIKTDFYLIKSRMDFFKQYPELLK